MAEHKVSVIIACRNEEAFLHKCLLSLVDQDYPSHLVEIIIVDGMSTDQTWGVANHFRETYPNIKLEVNQKKFKYPGLNQALEHADGDFIAIVDGHSEYPKSYLSQCVSHLSRTVSEIVNVGGGRIFFPRTKGWLTRALMFVQTEGLHFGHKAT